MTSTLAPPSFLWLEITGKCQLSCSHCYADSSPTGTHGTMTEADWTRVIDEAAELGVRTVQFIGGEPTLHPALANLINHALHRGLAVEVFTNLVHITPVLWEVFAQTGVSLATSYYSDDPAEHAAITGRPTHARTKANITEALRRGIPIRAGVIDLDDTQHVEQAHEELTNLGVSKISGDRLRQVGRGVRNLQESAEELCGGCGDGVAAIGPDGSVQPCVFTRWTTPLGNVRDEDQSNIYDRLPEARTSLIAQGMPTGIISGSNECPPKGGQCYPQNCPPKW